MKRSQALVAGGVATVLVLGGVLFVQNSGRSGAAAYVTSAAVRSDITQRVVLSGVVTRDNQATLTFDSPGTVTEVRVKVGDRVTAGQPIAAIDAAALRATRLQAEAQLAIAVATLDADLKAKDAGSAPTLPFGGGLPTAAAPGGQPSTMALPSQPSPGSIPPYLSVMQDSLTGLNAAVAEQQLRCQPFFALADRLGQLPSSLPSTLPSELPSTLPSVLPSTLPTWLPSTLPTGLPSSLPTQWPTSLPTSTSTAVVPTPGQSASASTTPTSPDASTTPTPTGPATSTAPTPSSTTSSSPVTPSALPSLPVAEVREALVQLEQCSIAMVGLARAEAVAGQAIGQAAAAMAEANRQAATQLMAAQQELMKAATEAGQKAAEQAMAAAQAQLAAQAKRAFGQQVTDATVATDQARVESARQQVARAALAVEGATLTAPISGIVGVVGFEAGESSVGNSVMIVGEGSATVSVEVPLNIRPLVASGMTGSMGLVGTAPSLRAQVLAVSVLPSNTSGSPTYAADVVADDPTNLLYQGSRAEVTLQLRTASDVIAVPVSAITRVTDVSATVQVADNARAEGARTVTVLTGALGQGLIEISSGLEPGQLVVLADRREPVPGGLQQYRPPDETSATPTPRR